MSQTNQRDYIVFSMELAGYLMMNSIRLIKTKPNKDNPDKQVYFFPNTKETILHVEKYRMLRK